MVIELKKTGTMNVTPIDLLPEPLKKIRGQASRFLSRMLAGMFDNTDDALFELADKAAEASDQTLYFDSMREVRLKREAMEARFVQKVEQYFTGLGRKSAPGLTDSASSFDGDALALVGEDELEESVALRGMVSKGNNQFGIVLSQLSQRMDSLIKTKRIDNEANPLGPAKLCDAFKQAGQELALDIRAKLVVFKLFERFVLAELGDLYEWANQSLAEAGVLPEIRPVVSRSKATIRKPVDKPPVSPEGPAASASDEKNVVQFKEAFSLLQELRSQLNVARQSSLPVADSGPVLSQSELLQLLSVVQQHNMRVTDKTSDSQQLLDVSQALGKLISEDSSGAAKAVGRVDGDAINLVSMLFEFILDDKNLPVAMKALLGRLQIPLLKVCLLDKTFFNRGGHPARKLLNELARAAFSWNPPADIQQDPLYKMVQSVVETVLNEFDADISLFARLYEEFSGFYEGEQRKSTLIERRTRDAEEGLAKTQRARAEVGQVINARAAGKALPPVVVELLREGWSNYLFLVYVKQGPDSEAWQAAVQVVDDLVWSVASEDEPGRRASLLKMIPSLLSRLREGLTATAFSKNRMRELFSALETAHMTCLRRHSDEDEQGRQPLPTEESEVIVPAPQLEPLNEKPAQAAVNDEFGELVASMAVGAWVEFVENDTKKTRCKLAAIIRSTGKYIFVNRVGMKVAEHTYSSLISAARERGVIVLDNALLFDRALESVIGHLREMKD